jgi:hypothetical protein
MAHARVWTSSGGRTGADSNSAIQPRLKPFAGNALPVLAGTHAANDATSFGSGSQLPPCLKNRGGSLPPPSLNWLSQFWGPLHCIHRDPEKVSSVCFRWRETILAAARMRLPPAVLHLLGFEATSAQFRKSVQAATAALVAEGSTGSVPVLDGGESAETSNGIVRLRRD